MYKRFIVFAGILIILLSFGLTEKSYALGLYPASISLENQPEFPSLNTNSNAFDLLIASDEYNPMTLDKDLNSLELDEEEKPDLSALENASTADSDEEYSLADTIIYTASLSAVTFVTFWLIWWRKEGFNSDFRWHEWSWFERDAEDGGSDKLGHLWACYVATRAFSQVIQWWGFSKETAIIISSSGTFFLINLAEFVDGFTHHTCDQVDALFNTIGIAWGVLTAYYPVLDDLFGLRMGYFPSEPLIEYVNQEFEAYPMVDYNGMTFYFDIKFAGFEHFTDDWDYFSRYLIIGFNYTVDYYQPDYDPEKSMRLIGMHFGINIGQIFRDHTPELKFFSSFLYTILKYIAIPYTTINFQYDLNHNETRINFGIRAR